MRVIIFPHLQITSLYTLLYNRFSYIPILVNSKGEGRYEYKYQPEITVNLRFTLYVQINIKIL